MRLFIAINFDQDTKSKITSLAQRLKRMNISGNYTKEQNYHLTMLFLGESDNRQLQIAKRAIQDIKINPFDITIQNLSNFSKNILHLKVRPCPSLNQIHQYLFERLKDEFSLTSSSFSPHITLVRKPSALPQENNDVFGDILPINYYVDSISLMLSTRENRQLAYKPLYVHKL